MNIEAYGRTDVGPVRDNNEDSLLLDTEMGVFVVADGMGGHAGGEVASEMAVNAVHSVLIGQTDPDETQLVAPDTLASTDQIMAERLRYAMNQASIQIRKESEERPETRGMGTTVVAIVVDGRNAYIAHVGDSRAYLLRGGELTRLTRDHTVVQQEIDAGRLTPELARLLPHRNLLTQSVGYHGPVEPDTSHHEVQGGDVFMMCTDGLTDVLDDDRIAELMRGAAVEDLCDVLVDAALENGTQDNVTVAVVGT